MDQGSEYIVGWGTLALIKAGLAQGKNRSGLIWFLISLIFGPEATFALVTFAPALPPSRVPLSTDAKLVKPEKMVQPKEHGGRPLGTGAGGGE